MPVSGLVITLSENSRERETALAALAAEPRIDVGAMSGARLPIVVDTATSDEDRQVWEWLHNLCGVRFVDVACIHFDEDREDARLEHAP